VKILTITGLCPRPAAPTQGVFIKQRVLALRARGAEVRVIAPLPWVPPGPVPERYRRIRETPAEAVLDGLAVRYPRYLMIPKFGMRRQAAGYARGIRGAVAEELAGFRPDVLDAHYLYPDACGVARVARAFDVPYACTARGSDVKVLARFPAIARRIREALAGAAAVIAVSEDLAETMRRMGLVERPVTVIPNGVDGARFRPRDRFEARLALDLPAGEPFVVCVGHLVPVHGQERLVRALAEPGAPAGLALRFVGAGPDRAALEALAASLGVAGRVHFAGVVPHDRMPLWFSAADFSAQLSTSAGCPNAVLESIACRVPVLATDLPEMREVIRTERDGVCVEPVPGTIARAMVRLLAADRPALPEPGSVRGWDDVADRVLDAFVPMPERATLT
jgi:glycosyltransferase involved in cell wall biosynthesis